MNLKELREKRDAYITIFGRDNAVYIDDSPWEIAKNCEEGSSYRLSVPTSVWFYGVDPQTGLKIRWSLDIERRDANGKGRFDIDTKKVSEVMALLPREARRSFAGYLKKIAVSIRERADEYQQAAMDQYAMAAVFENLGQQS